MVVWCSFHIIANHGEEVAACGNQLDYVGVVILMSGSTIPSIYYGFYCDAKLQRLYWAVVSSSLLCCVLLFHLQILPRDANMLRVTLTPAIGYYTCLRVYCYHSKPKISPP